MKYPITCRQTDHSDSDHVIPPVFAVRNGQDGSIKVISDETAGYDIAAGKLNRSNGLLFQYFYLIVEVTLEDNNKQFVCVNENDSENEESLQDAFLNYLTEIVVSSAESKFFP